MSRHINADKAIEYFKSSHHPQTAKLIDNMANNADYFFDAVSREQYNEVYAKNLELRAEILELKSANEKLLQGLHNMAECFEVD